MYQCFTNAKLIHSQHDMGLEILQNKVLIVNKDTGKIEEILEEENWEQNLNGISVEELDIIRLTDKQFLMPGFIDTHVHAPQFANNGCALDLQLLDWLHKYTFPEEKKFSDLDYAEKIYELCVDANICNGTTTICFFGTIHSEATQLLARVIDERGMRGFVGKVCMDQNSPVDYIEQNAEESCKKTIEFIEGVQAKSPRVTPVVTPRFAPTCSKQLLRGLGKISKKYNIPVQTHLSENKKQIEFVAELFPEFESYTETYQKTGLLGQKSVLAHCVYLKQQEMEIIKETNSGISHCPNSNISITSGIAPIRKYLDYGMKIGLGTDCSGGYAPSMLDSIRYCILSSKVFNMSHPQHAPLTYPQAFYLSTRGGAKLLGLEEEVGHFSKGMQFDALLIDYENFKSSYIREDEPMTQIFEKMIYLMNQNQIAQVFVRGKNIKC